MSPTPSSSKLPTKTVASHVANVDEIMDVHEPRLVSSVVMLNKLETEVGQLLQTCRPTAALLALNSLTFELPFAFEIRFLMLRATALLMQGYPWAAGDVLDYAWTMWNDPTTGYSTFSGVSEADQASAARTLVRLKSLRTYTVKQQLETMADVDGMSEDEEGGKSGGEEARQHRLARRQVAVEPVVMPVVPDYNNPAEVGQTRDDDETSSSASSSTSRSVTSDGKWGSSQASTVGSLPLLSQFAKLGQ